MIRIPNPGRAKDSFFRFISLIAIFFAFVGTTRALEPKQIEITIPERVEVNNEISIQIRILDIDGKILKKDSRQLKIEIVNNDVVNVKDVHLKNGQAKLTHTFNKQGATLITTVDPMNKHLVNYSGFTVHDTKEGK